MNVLNLGQRGRSWKERKWKWMEKRSAVCPLGFVGKIPHYQRERLGTSVSQKMGFQPCFRWHLEPDNLLQWGAILPSVPGHFPLAASDIPSHSAPELWQLKVFPDITKCPLDAREGGGNAEGTCFQLRAIWMKWTPTSFSIVHKWVQRTRESLKTQFWIVWWLSNYLGTLYYTFLSKSSGPLESLRTGVRRSKAEEGLLLTCVCKQGDKSFTWVLSF